MRISDFLMDDDQKFAQASIYQTGAESIQKYLDMVEAFDVENQRSPGSRLKKDYLEAFNSAMLDTDARIIKQAESLRNNVDELGQYQRNLQSAADGLLSFSSGVERASTKTKALSGLMKAGNAIVSGLGASLASMAISFVASKLFEGIDYLIHEEEYIAEAAEEAESKVDDLRSSYQSMSNTVLGISGEGGIAQEFAELSQGVSSTGKNLSLASDDYNRFLELSNQLAEIFPTLSRHYDENGNAIVDLSGDVDTVVTSLQNLVETEQQLANSQILGEFDTVFKDVVNQLDNSRAREDIAAEEAASLQVSLDAMERGENILVNEFANTGHVGSITVPIELKAGVDANQAIDDYLRVLHEHDIGSTATYTDNLVNIDIPVEEADKFLKYSQSIRAEWDAFNYGVVSSEVVSQSQRQLQQQEFELQQAAQQERVIQQQQIARLQPYIQALLENSVSYLDLSSIGQDIVSQIGASLDPSSFANSEAMLDYIQTDLLGVYQDLMATDFGSIYEQLFSLSEDPDVDARRFLDLADETTASLMKAFDVESVDALAEEYPIITYLFDQMYGEVADQVERFDARIEQLTGDKGLLDGLIVSSSDMELALGLSDAYDTVEDFRRAFIAAKSVAGIDTQLEEITATVDAYSEYQTALSNALSSQELSVEQYETLIGYSEEYRDALMLEGEQMTLNREAVAEINKAQQEKIQGNIKEGRSAAQIAYHRNRQELEALRDTYESFKASGKDTADILAQISELETNQVNLQDAINQYNILSGVLSEVSQAYKQYETASAASSPEEHYETNLGAMDALEEGLNSGKVGTSEFMAAVDLMIPVDVYKGKVDEVAAIGEYYEDTLSRYFTPTGENEDDYSSGITNFLNDAESAGLMSKTIDESGLETWTVNAGMKLADFAEQLGITEAAAESMFRVMDSYTFGGKAFDFSDELLGDTASQMYFYESEIDKLEAQKQELLADPDINWDSSEVRELQTQIDELKQKKESLSQETVVSVQARVDIMDQIDEVESKIAELDRTIQSNAPEDVKIQAKLEKEQLESQLGELENELAEAGGTPTTFQVEIAIENIQEQKQEVLSEIQSIDPGAIVVDGELQLSGQVRGSEDLRAAYDEWNSLNTEEKNLVATFNISTTGETTLEAANATLDECQTKLDKINATTANPNADTTAIDNLKTSAANANSEISNLIGNINSIPNRAVYITTYYQTVGKPAEATGSASRGVLSRSSRAQGTAHASGTARAKGTDLFPSDWKLKRPELALTGELGPEMVVRGNEWFLVGEGGAEFNQLKKGDIVFNHQQTEDLLHRGSTFGRGKARLKGTLPEEGLALVTGSFSFRKYQTSNWSGGSGSSGSGSSSSRTEASYNYNGSGGSSGSSDEDDFRETIDWVEKELDRLQRKIDQTAITAESAYKTFSERNKALASEYDQITNKMEENRKGIARYEAEANSVGLSESYAKLVRDGTIDIETITDEDLKDKIDQYTEWYEKALDLRDENAELEETLRDLAAQNFDNLITEYEGVLATIEHKKSVLDTYIDMAELRGQFVSAQYYTALLAQEQNNIKTLSEKRKELNNELNNLVDNKEVEIYSEKWYEFKGEIESTDEALAEANNTLQELSNTIRELEWDRFDYIEERVSRIATEADFLAGLIGDENLFDPDTAAYTDRATTLAGLYGQNYTLYMDQAESYAAEIEKINAELAKDPSNQLLIERKEELVDAQYDSVEAAMDERDAMLSLAEEGYQAQLDILDKLIDKKREARDAERDLYEYQRDVAEQTENIASLQKQLAVYDAQDTEESRKTSQELRTQLEEAQDNLEQTQYDRFVADQDKLFDDLTTEYQDFIDKRLADSDALFADMMNMVNTNASVIGDTLRETADRVGVDLSASISNIWAADNPVSVFSTQFADASASVISILDAIRQQFAAYAAASDKEAAGANDSINSSNDNIGTGNPKPPSSSSGSGSGSSSSGSSGSSGTGIYGTGKVTAPSGLNLRAGASTSTKVLAAYGQGTQVTVLERVNNEWYKVKTADGKTGYMNAAWLSVTKSSGSASGNAIKGTGTITAPSGLNLRASNSTNSKVLAAYGYGTKVSVTEQKGDWYKVKAPDGKEGWMYGDWLKVAKQAAYAKGGVIGDVIRASGEDGMILARSGEAVLTADQLKLLRDTVSVGGELITPLRDVFSVLSSAGRNGGNMTMTIENITLPNVTDPSEFADGLRDALKNDPQTQKAIRAITIDQLAGKNSLSVRKY